MRTCLAFILSIMFSLNTAYATSVGICDALKHTSHTAHIGLHSHEHDDGQDAPSLDPDEEGKSNCHDHVHPSFSSILPNTIGITPMMGCSILVVAPVSTILSAPQTLLERPPRVALA